MEIKRTLILGIDALEYDLVEHWNLQNLKQEEYGKTVLPIEKRDGFLYELPATLIMWVSFITGALPKRHKIQTFKVWDNKYLNWLEVNVVNRLLKPLQFDHATLDQRRAQQRLFAKIKKFPEFFGYTKREPMRMDIKSTTMFDTLKAVHLHVPLCDDDAFPPYKKKILEAIENKVYRPLFERQCLREYYQRTEEVLSWTQKMSELELFMEYFYVLDGVQHVFFNNPKKIARFYILFDEFVGKIRQHIDDEVLLLVVSDHGQRRGTHTDYGFYSTNKPLGLKCPHLINFRSIIEGILKNGREKDIDSGHRCG